MNNNKLGGFPVGRFIYEAGSGTNVSLLFEQTVGFEPTPPYPLPPYNPYP